MYDVSLRLLYVYCTSCCRIGGQKVFSFYFQARSYKDLVDNLKGEIFMYVIQHCFICRPSGSTASEDARIEFRTVAALALTGRPLVQMRSSREFDRGIMQKNIVFLQIHERREPSAGCGQDHHHPSSSGGQGQVPQVLRKSLSGASFLDILTGVGKVDKDRCPRCFGKVFQVLPFQTF